MERKEVDITRKIAQFVVQTNQNQIPPQIYEHAKVAFMDWFAVLMAGKDEPLVSKLLRYADLLGGFEQATVVGHGLKKNVCQAALINGAASHALDYDDTLRSFMGHPSVTLFPGLLAFSEWKEKRGIDFLHAYIIALKVGATIGACAGFEHYSAGWHGTSTVGRFASAAGCAKLMGLDEQQTLYALGIAGTQTCGLKRVFGSMCKPFHAGSASQGGLMAAILADEGFNSAEDILEGTNGFFQAFKGRVREKFVSSLGKTWDIEALAQKYHASCHFTHSPIEAVLKIANRERLTYRDIKNVNIYVSRIALDTAGYIEPRTDLEGKFSLRYCVANALLRDDTGLHAFTDEKVNAPEVKEVMEKVKVIVDPEIPEDSWFARAEVKLHSDKIYEDNADVSQEIPDLETKIKKIGGKFAELCTPVLGKAKTTVLKDSILTLEKSDSMKDFIDQVHS